MRTLLSIIAIRASIASPPDRRNAMRVLTTAQKQQFEEQGYLLVEDLLDPVADIQPVLDEYIEGLDGFARTFYDEGLIGSTYASLAYAERLVAVCAESGKNFP